MILFDTMIIAYIAHPIGGDVNGNLRDLQRIIKHVNLNEKNVVPFCPYMADVLSLDDSILSHRVRAFQNNHHYFHEKMIDEFWLTGTRISKGMRIEIQWAIEFGIPIVDKINKI
jgi:hypothetical protein